MTQTTTSQKKTIVSQIDFPQRSERLQELIHAYQKVEGLVTWEIMSNPLEFISSGCKIREIKELNPKEEEIVRTRIKSTNYLNSKEIQTFGSVKANPMMSDVKSIIDKNNIWRRKGFEYPLQELVVKLKANRLLFFTPKIESVEGFISAIEYIFCVSETRKRMYKFFRDDSSVERNIQKVEEDLKRKTKSFEDDITIYEKIGKSICEQILNCEFDCIALDAMIEEANMLLEAYKSDDTKVNDIKMLEVAIDQMRKKKVDIRAIQLISAPTVNKLSGLIDENIAICKKIYEVTYLLIPLWKWQYHIMMKGLKEKSIVGNLKAMGAVASSIFSGNSKMFHDNMLDLQKQMDATTIAMEDLETIKEYIVSVLNTVIENRKQVSQNCIDVMERIDIAEDEKRCRNLITNVR